MTTTTTAEIVKRYTLAMQHIGESMLTFGRAMESAAAQFGRMAGLIRVGLLHPKTDPRERYGAWNFTGDGLWQSDLCASWVHGECPLPGRCDCTCHGGSLH